MKRLRPKAIDCILDAFVPLLNLIYFALLTQLIVLTFEFAPQQPHTLVLLIAEFYIGALIQTFLKENLQNVIE